MLFPRIPSRPVRYALIATHAFRDAIADVDVDFTKAERAIADRLDALTTKVDALMDRLAAYEEANDETTTDEQPKAQRPAKAKAKAGTKRRAKK